MLALAVTLALGTVVILLWSAPSDTARQPISLLPHEINLGSVPAGETRHFEASLRNNLHVPIRIGQLSTSCGCTQVRAAKLQLTPGESTVIKGTVRAGGSERTFQHHVLITTASPHIYQLRCTIIGETQHPLVCSPHECVLRPTFISDEAHSLQFTIRNNSEHTVALHVRTTIPVGVSLGWMELDLAPQSLANLPIKADAGYVIPRQFNLTIDTTDPTQRVINIPVRIEPACKVTLRPSAVPFGVLSSREFRTLDALTVDAHGEILKSSDVEQILVPAWLQLVSTTGVRSGAGDTLQFSFLVQHALAPTELESTIDFAWRHRPTGRVLRAQLATSGFLLDASTAADAD